MKSITGDIRDFREVLSAVDGVDVVIHTAALICIKLFPDIQALEDINVKGKSYYMQIDAVSKCIFYCRDWNLMKRETKLNG